MNTLLKPEEKVVYALRELYRSRGYAPFKMSKFEAYDLYMQNKDFLVSDGVITFTEADGTLMALKPDVTLSIVKNFRKDSTPLQKVYYSENVYRREDSFREIMQAGLECLGDVGCYEICEVIVLAAKSLAAISDRFVLDISHLQIVTDLLDAMPIDFEQKSQILRAIADKNEDALLIEGVDTSLLCRLLRLCGPIGSVLPRLAALCSTDGAKEALNQLETVYRILKQYGLEDHIQLDFSIVNDMNYYNGIVFRGYVDGIPTGVLAGGQYDKLMSKMNKNAGGIGFAVYLDQLERLNADIKEFDVDVILLYDRDTDIPALSAEADKVCSDGRSILLLKEPTDGLRCRQLMKYKDGRAELLENNG